MEKALGERGLRVPGHAGMTAAGGLAYGTQRDACLLSEPVKACVPRAVCKHVCVWSSTFA